MNTSTTLSVQLNSVKLAELFVGAIAPAMPVCALAMPVCANKWRRHMRQRLSEIT